MTKTKVEQTAEAGMCRFVEKQLEVLQLTDTKLYEKAKAGDYNAVIAAFGQLPPKEQVRVNEWLNSLTLADITREIFGDANNAKKH